MNMTNKVLFIGAGAMAEAILAGMVQQKVVPSAAIFVSNKNDDTRLLTLQQQYGISLAKEEPGIYQEATTVIYATKPADIQKALAETAPNLSKEAVIVSVIAGIPIATFESYLSGQAVARVMPNTSATIGHSASGIAWNGQQSKAQYAFVTELLEAIGLVKEVTEEQLHTVTALSGSGPAYVYYFVEALEKAATAHGIEAATARELTIQTLKGAALMLEQTKAEPAQLRENVTSPNGTTFAGLEAMRSLDFERLIEQCIAAAKHRSIELGK